MAALLKCGLACGALTVGFAGCGSEEGSLGGEDGDGNGSGGGNVGTACGTRYETKACSCDDLQGAQFCSSSNKWTECECQLASGGTVKGSTKAPENGSDVPAGNLRSDITFDWNRTEATQGSCEPGYYEGTFSGLYTSQITFVGVPIPVTAVSIPGKPGLSFTLTKKPGSGEELVIENGIMDGLADGAFPFIGTLTGSLNCETLRFEAILDGYYSLGVQGIGMWKFKGPLLADYDKATRSVINATWDVDEYDPPPMTVLPAGGMGSWSATWLRP